MARIHTYIMILTVTLILFHLAGFIQDTGSTFLLDTILDPANINTSSWYSELFGILTGLTVAVITVGLITRVDTGLLITIGLVNIFFLIGFDFVRIFLVISNDLGYPLGVLVMSPLITVYFLTVGEWWTQRGGGG